ncbi:cyclin 9 [Stylonychia lemnae]|uniref:Cyclin 9 n=1 Tax=Stylonychia lemnae TaxID=5949 RepID=A0A078BA54_STYLE|nr:cyclin 9 [Stylonychia lemnae]|eukprot:CDW91380.1 cyclin 9 [Stylonychia lemnae]
MHVCGIALTIFHYYQKRHPFTEFDRYMLSTLCLFLACKIDYFKFQYFDFIEYYYHNRKQGRGRVKPFDEIKESLKENFIDLEFKVLITIEFDFDIDSPYEYLNIFYYQHRKILFDKVMLNPDEAKRKMFEVHYKFFIELAKKFIYDSYIHPFCLYFPAPCIAAACIFISADLFLKTNHQQESNIIDVKLLGSQILEEYNLKSFLEVEITDDPDINLVQNHAWLNLLLPVERQQNERVSMVDVLFLQNEILQKIADQVNTPAKQ